MNLLQLTITQTTLIHSATITSIRPKNDVNMSGKQYRVAQDTQPDGVQNARLQWSINMSEKIDGTISLIGTKIAKDDKDAFFARCEERGVKPSLVLRKLISEWVNNEIKLEI